ncbi:hypothetical protein MTR67_024002 [Solanum verrucosum]|uniref:Uncharacterized protein n=1 Tax=Solanum verrucosum TaxID=315347 RepID=A0AAF0QXZ9_SOLVR|nr:hypothetical protein MTR67_024002 [Solanum verrucosum]
MDQDGALPLQDAALNVNVPLNLFGFIGVADPARNMVAERDQEAQRDRVVAIAHCPRFEARSCLAPPFRGLTDPNIETAILASASNSLFPGNPPSSLALSQSSTTSIRWTI